jgi:hypothetical protein
VQHTSNTRQPGPEASAVEVIAMAPT